MKKNSLRFFLIIAAMMTLLGVATRADATPITYQISGLASGTIGASTFTNAVVTVSLTGDTSNVVADPFGAACPANKCFVNVALGPTTVNISGIGTAAITGCNGTPTCNGASAIYSFGLPISIAPGAPVLPYVVIGTLGAPPAVDDFLGLAAVGSNDFLDYDLRTYISPISSVGGFGSPCCLFHTTRGDLKFVDSPIGGTFTFTAVPEPSSLILLGIGLAGFAGARFQYRQKVKESK